MAAQPVEWVLVIYYGRSAHRATYGRLDGKNTKYTKDYIQLSRKKKFLEATSRLFSVTASGAGSVPLTFQWPMGTTPGAFVFKSADRPHLKWETKLGAPQAWRMALSPSESSAETIPGDSSHLDFVAAEKEFALLTKRGAGQPYLLAIKLRDEPKTLHLRTYLKSPSSKFAWADFNLMPKVVRDLATKTSEKSALAWSIFQSGGTAPSVKIEDALRQLDARTDWTPVIDSLDGYEGRALVNYLRRPGYGLFFDSTRNHDAWLQPTPLSKKLLVSVGDFMGALEARFPRPPQGDAAAETSEVDPDELHIFRNQIEHKNYGVSDSIATTKTRGSAQRAFAEAVKSNYGWRCAITGIVTRNFLVASHIVPWSVDQSIRLDPSNGICLSLIVDRALEKGYLLIDDDFIIRIDWNRVGDDDRLRSQLEPHDGQKLRMPLKEAPQPEYLRRRRALILPPD